MSREECICFEKKLACHSAPSLLGIKCSNLISFDADEPNLYSHMERFNRKAKSKGLKIKKLCQCRNKTLVLIYRERLLEKILCDRTIREFLEIYGYSNSQSIDNDLEKLSERISCYHNFPHEIGVFLGYPIEDVIGFIENKGENYKFCGCWKVYGDVEKAKRIFSNYDKCRNFLCSKLEQGSDIYTALRIS